jgi:hypothetical protein
MNKAHCRGCRDDFYNGEGAKECWHLKDAALVPRFRIGTWTEPTQKGAFTKVNVPSCFNHKGEHFYKALPDFVKASDVRKDAP